MDEVPIVERMHLLVREKDAKLFIIEPAKARRKSQREYPNLQGSILSSQSEVVVHVACTLHR